MTRSQSIRVIFISAVLIVLIISGLVLFREWQNRKARVDRRLPLQGLGYCTSEQVTPCVVSFSLDSGGNMLVSFLTEGAFYPDFYLKIKAGESDHTYVCEKVNTFASSVYCTGKAMPIGKVYQFRLFSLNEDILLAQGNFPIIGLALVTPEIFFTPTPAPAVTSTPSYPSYPNAGPE